MKNIISKKRKCTTVKSSAFESGLEPQSCNKSISGGIETGTARLNNGNIFEYRHNRESGQLEHRVYDKTTGDLIVMEMFDTDDCGYFVPTHKYTRDENNKLYLEACSVSVTKLVYGYTKEGWKHFES